jgi:NitT/TauT family transport system ATP-binding protein
LHVVARLEFRHVTKRFLSKLNGATIKENGEPFITAVRDISLRIQDGEVVSLIGPSGCGKSTLLTMGSGLDRPSEGEVYVDGELVTRPNPHVAFMLQKDLLLPWRTIRQNVEFGLEIQGTPADERRSRADELLRKCRLADFAEHSPHQLSGGMRQRAALARTLAVDPTVLLLDEPFSALDAQTKMILQQDLGRTLRETGKTALFITHDLVEAITLSDRILVMSERPGELVDELVVDLPDRGDPMTRRQHPGVGQFIPKLMSLLHLSELAL